MNEQTAILTSSVTCPRWAKFPSFLRQTCFMGNLKLEMDIDKGWLTETTAFKITGPVEKIQEFSKTLQKSIKEYNQ